MWNIRGRSTIYRCLALMMILTVCCEIPVNAEIQVDPGEPVHPLFKMMLIDVSGSGVQYPPQSYDTLQGDLIRSYNYYLGNVVNIDQSKLPLLDLNDNEVIDVQDREYLRKVLVTVFEGDVNLNFAVGLEDLAIIATNFASNANTRDDYTWAEGDITHNGIVDLEDLAKLATNFGRNSFAFSKGEWVVNYEFDELANNKYSAQVLTSGVTLDTGYDATAVSISQTTTDAIRGKVLSLNGVDQYLELPDHDDLNKKKVEIRTITLWFKVDDVPDVSSDDVQMIYEEGNNIWGMNAYIHNGKLYVGQWNYRPISYGGQTYDSFLDWGDWYDIDPNELTHQADAQWWSKWHRLDIILKADGITELGGAPLTTNSGAISIYLDGEEVVSGATGVYLDKGPDPNTSNTRDPILFGASNQTRLHTGEYASSTVAHHFKGKLDDIRIIDSLLTEEQLRLDDALIAHWPLDGNLINTKNRRPISTDDIQDVYADYSYERNGRLDWALHTTEVIEVDNSQNPPVSTTRSKGVSLAEAQYESYFDINKSIFEERAISLWVKLDSQAENVTGRKMVIYEQGGDQRGLNIYINPEETSTAGVFKFKLYAGAWNQPDNSVGTDWEGCWLVFTPQDSGIDFWEEWRHVVFVLDADSTIESNALKLYIDGVEITQTGESDPNAQTVDPTTTRYVGSAFGSQLWPHEGKTVGAGQDVGTTRFHDADSDESLTADGDQWLEGFIDDIRIYNRALTSDSIAKIYSYQPAEMIAHWKLDNDLQQLSTVDSVGSNDLSVVTSSGATIGNEPFWAHDAALDSGYIAYDTTHKDDEYDQDYSRWLEKQSPAGLDHGLGDFTISLWVQLHGLPTDNSDVGIMSHYDNSGSGVGYRIYATKVNSNIEIRMSVDNGDSSDPMTVTIRAVESAKVRTWYHLVFTIERSGALGAKAFVNGKRTDAVSANDLTGHDLTHSGPILIGKSYNIGVSAVIDEVKMFKGVISKSQIQSEYSAGVVGAGLLLQQIMEQHIGNTSTVDSDGDGLPDDLETALGFDQNTQDFTINGDGNGNGVSDSIDLAYHLLGQTNTAIPAIINMHPVNGSTIALPQPDEDLYLTLLTSNVTASDEITITDEYGNDITSNANILAGGIEIRIDNSDVYEAVNNQSELLSGVTHNFTITITKNNINYTYIVGYAVDASLPYALPTINGGNYFNVDITGLDVELTGYDNAVPDPGVTIYYSTDGSYPSVLYEGKLTFHQTTLLKYYAIDAAGNKSPVIQQVYYLGAMPLPPMNVEASYSENAGNHEVSLSWDYVNDQLQAGDTIKAYRIYQATNPIDLQLLKESQSNGYPAPNYLLLDTVQAANGTNLTLQNLAVGATTTFAVSAVITSNNIDHESIAISADPVELDGAVASGEIDQIVRSALLWIESTQKQSGYWGGKSRIASTCMVLNALADHPEWMRSHKDLVYRALAFLHGQHPDDNGSIAWQIKTLQRFGWDTRGHQMRLYQRASIIDENTSKPKAWGTDPHHLPDALHTVLSIDAYQDYTLRIAEAKSIDPRSFMIGNDKFNSVTTGTGPARYGWVPRNRDSIYVSMLANKALGLDLPSQSSANSYDWIASLGGASGFRDNVLDTASALGMLKRNLQWTPLQHESYLLNNRDSNSVSWNNGDHFSTALAIRSLNLRKCLLIVDSYIDTNGVISYDGTYANSNSDLADILSDKGYEVIPKTISEDLEVDIGDYTLIVVAGSAPDDWNDDDKVALISNAKAGMLVLNPYLYDDFGMSISLLSGDPVVQHASHDASNINVDNLHRLNAYHATGTLIVTSNQALGFALIPDASTHPEVDMEVASGGVYPIGLENYHITYLFGYRPGADLVNNAKANARRVGHFGYNAIDNLNDAGLDMLERAIDWAAWEVSP